MFIYRIYLLSIKVRLTSSLVSPFHGIDFGIISYHTTCLFCFCDSNLFLAEFFSQVRCIGKIIFYCYVKCHVNLVKGSNNFTSNVYQLELPTHSAAPYNRTHCLTSQGCPDVAYINTRSSECIITKTAD